MIFTSYSFLGFIAMLFFLYYLVPKRLQWVLLLVFGYIFYFLSNPRYLAYILITTISVFLMGCAIDNLQREQASYLKVQGGLLGKDEKKKYKGRVKRRQWKLLLAGIIINLGILAVVKYANFAISNINAAVRWLGGAREFGHLDIVLPMGISFYTFQAVGYLIDVYRGTCRAERNLFKFALFVSFFPQLVQGPISRFGSLSATLYEEHSFDIKMACYGLQRILWGFFKKLVIADRILICVAAIVKNPEAYSGAWVFAGMMFYALELYADFTGGIDIAIGVAEVMGIKVEENFKRPYFSKSVKEYWRRWHITMGAWFTDYIFYPISVCKPMLKISKFSRKHFGESIGKRVPVYLSSFAVWLATGIWHGAGWNFVVWGLGNWAAIMMSQELEPLFRVFHARFHVKGCRIFQMFQIARTVLIMSVLRTFDCYRDVTLTFRMLGTMFTERNWGILWDGSLLGVGIGAADYIILLLGTAILLLVSMAQRTGKVRDKIASKPYPLRFAVWYGMFLAVLVFGIYGIGYDASQFIYNQF